MSINRGAKKITSLSFNTAVSTLLASSDIVCTATTVNVKYKSYIPVGSSPRKDAG
jgi:hypothetical protein